jgi:hypothetical protein
MQTARARGATEARQSSAPAPILPLLMPGESRQASTASMLPVHHTITHKTLHAEYARANVLVKKQICRLIHRGATAAECVVFIWTIEQDLCDADPVGGPSMCRRFEVERKTEEKNLVLVEDMDMSEARTVAAANQSYKLTTALANARRVLPDGGDLLLIAFSMFESIGYAAMFNFILNQASSQPHVWGVELRIALVEFSRLI